MLLHRIVRDFIIGDQHQICACKSDPMNDNLTVNQSFIYPA